MSMNWAEDMNRMHKKYGVHEKINEMDKETLKKFLHFRVGTPTIPSSFL